MTTIYILLALILGIVLLVPFLFKAVEERLEFFLLLSGACSVSASHSWSKSLILSALWGPLGLTLAVLGFSALFKLSEAMMRRRTEAFARSFGVKALAFVLVAGLGLLSGLATALVAALALAEAASLIQVDRSSKIRLVVLGCYAIGLGAVLSPFGGPLATISMERLGEGQASPDYWMLTRLLGPWICSLIAALAVAAYFWVEQGASGGQGADREKDSYPGLIFRAAKVYVFVVGLELLGAGFNPATGDLLKSLPGWALYWVSLVSAVLDNASLAAAGLSPAMTQQQLKYFMLGLMISGGMLVPGNFPNIVCAGKLQIGMKEWARFALPLGLAMMAAVFSILVLAGWINFPWL